MFSIAPVVGSGKTRTLGLMETPLVSESFCYPREHGSARYLLAQPIPPKPSSFDDFLFGATTSSGYITRHLVIILATHVSNG